MWECRTRLQEGLAGKGQLGQLLSTFVHVCGEDSVVGCAESHSEFRYSSA